MSQNSDLIGYTLQKFFPAECKVDQLCGQWQLFEKKIPKCYALLADVYLKENYPENFTCCIKLSNKLKSFIKTFSRSIFTIMIALKFSTERRVARPLSSIQ